VNQQPTPQPWQCAKRKAALSLQNLWTLPPMMMKLAQNLVQNGVGLIPTSQGAIQKLLCSIVPAIVFRGYQIMRQQQIILQCALRLAHG
jgi:urease accessory protein UreF